MLLKSLAEEGRHILPDLDKFESLLFFPDTLGQFWVHHFPLPAIELHYFQKCIRVDGLDHHQISIVCGSYHCKVLLLF